MPPRSAKKAAAKKPSPRPKRSPLAKSASNPAEDLPAVEEEESLEAVEAPVAAEDGEDAEREQKTSLEPEGDLSEPGTGPDPANAKVEDAKEEAVAAAELAPAAVEEEPPSETESAEEADEELPSETESAEEADVLMAARDEGEEGTIAAADVVEAEEHPEVVTDVKDGSDYLGAKQRFVEEETEAAKVEDTETCGPEGDDSVGDGDKSGSGSDADNDENEDKIDPSVYMDVPMTERKRNKQFEIFVGGLGKEAVEDDLLKVFGEFGEIQSARIVKHPKTQRSRGFAFIRYATVEQAKKVLSESKNGIEVRGKRVGVSASVDNDTLYLGNVCRTWTKDQVLETLKSFGLDQIEEILLPDDPKNEGKNKGFAFLEFSSHSVAMAAFQRLKKPDAVFGCDRSAKVDFAQFSMHPSEEALLQVKTVYLEALPLSWDEEKIREICRQYGEIENLQLSQNFSKNEQKHFGFIAFASHESAVACVEGINSAQVGEEETKVKANLATPQRKGRFAKQGAKGGFKVKKNGEMAKEIGQLKEEGQVKDKDTHGKGKASPKVRANKAKRSGKSPKPHGKVTGGKGGALGHQKLQPPRDGKRGRKATVIDNEARPSKKARNDSNFRNGSGIGFGTKRNAHSGASGSMIRHSDLEPHAGYLPAARRGQGPYISRRAAIYESQQSIGDGAYGHQQRIGGGGYDSQHIAFAGYRNQHGVITGEYNNSQRIGVDYAGGSVLQSSYPGYSTYSGHEAGYAYRRTGAYAHQGPYY